MADLGPDNGTPAAEGPTRYRSGPVLHPDRYRVPQNTRFREVLTVFAGGAAGTLLRVLFVETFPASGAGWPWPTLAANLLGAFVAGWLAIRLPGSRHAGKHPLLITGFCGGLTTFSTLQVELLDLIEASRTGTAALYAAVSLAAGMLVLVAAMRIARRHRHLEPSP